MASVGKVIAGEVRRHRLARGMSAQLLSERCAHLGAPIPRTVLSNLENGRRGNVTVAEVLVLARALDVTPAVLIFPAGYVERVEFLPGAEAHPMQAIQWLSGEGPVPSETTKGTRMSEMMHSAFFFIRQIAAAKKKLMDRLRDYRDLVDKEMEADDESLKNSYRMAAQRALESHEEGEQRIKEWVEMLKDGIPEMGISPVPHPDPEIAVGTITVEMVGSPFDYIERGRRDQE